MKIKNDRVYNFKGAFMGMRNPMNSWDKSDSKFGFQVHDGVKWFNEQETTDIVNKYIQKFNLTREQAMKKILNNSIVAYDDNSEIAECAIIGPEDMDLANRLIAAGPEHAKFLRQIFVTVDIQGPLYW